MLGEAKGSSRSEAQADRPGFGGRQVKIELVATLVTAFATSATFALVWWRGSKIKRKRFCSRCKHAKDIMRKDVYECMKRPRLPEESVSRSLKKTSVSYGRPEGFEPVASTHTCDLWERKKRTR